MDAELPHGNSQSDDTIKNECRILVTRLTSAAAHTARSRASFRRVSAMSRERTASFRRGGGAQNDDQSHLPIGVVDQSYPRSADEDGDG